MSLKKIQDLTHNNTVWYLFFIYPQALALDDTLALTHTIWSHIYRLKR